MNGKIATVRDALVCWMDGLLYMFVGPFSVVYIIPVFLLSLDGSCRESGFGLIGVEYAGLGLMVLGGLVAGWCIWTMLRVGGTPFVATPPRALVSVGLFGYVRNPMMWALLLVILGEALCAGSLLLFVWLAAFSRIGHLIVVSYEEPQLEARYGEAYREYCRRVPRWFPRRRRAKPAGKTP
jgi:protein-S-isoprenylcysteine O-methyltransferase Ste14